MNRRLVVILSIIIVTPLLLFFILGVKMAEQEEQYLQERFRGLLLSRLVDIKKEIMEIVARHERAFLNMQEVAEQNASGIRQFIRGHRMIRAVFLLDEEGQLLFPPDDSGQTAREQEFFIRTQSIWQDGESFYKPWEDAYDRVKIHGWYTWFWGKGINIIFWMRTAAAQTLGIEVDGSALVADLIGNLPDSGQLSPELSGGRIVLTDISGGIIYQWGSYSPGEEEAPFLRLPVDSPLDGWELRYYLAVEEFNARVSRGTLVTVVAGAVAVFVLLAVLGIYFYRENSRALREAARKVTFVNQVSHELKTPLTNIRLYAELLDSRIDPEDSRLRRYLGVIVAESQRLSRLILNVLTFARDRKKELTLHKAPGNVDEIIARVLQNHSQSFGVVGIVPRFERGVARNVMVDQDVLEQILNNLFSNVEKYAAAGKSLEVSSRIEKNRVLITVADRGTGISRDKREKIFKPFFRLSRKLSDGASGTGLGLTIARQLARLHGGDLTLLPGSGTGAVFQVELEIAK